MTRAGALALLLAALVLAGCGGTAKHAHKPKPMSHRAFVYAGNHACRVSARTNRRLKKPTSLAMALHNLGKEIASYEAVVVSFRKLTPPKSDAARFNRLLRGLDKFDLTAHRTLNDLQALDRRRIKLRLHELKQQGKKLDALSLRLGLRVCAKK